MTEALTVQPAILPEETELLEVVPEGSGAVDVPWTTIQKHAYFQAREFGLSEADASDVASESLLRIWRGLGQYQAREGASLESWCYTITIHALYDVLRRRGRPGHSFLGTAEDTVDRALDETVTSPSAEAIALGNMGAHMRIIAAFTAARVTKQEREVCILRHVFGLPYAEIARITGTELGTVRSRISRGLDKVRTHFGITEGTRRWDIFEGIEVQSDEI